MTQHTNKEKTGKTTLPHRENSDFQKNISLKFINPTSVEDKDIFLYFVEWVALPRNERKPQSQKEFAELYGIHYNTLSVWKGLSGFWDEVKIRRNVQMRKYTTRIIYNGIVKPALEGDVRATELFLRMFEGYKENVKIENTITQQTELSEERLSFIKNAMDEIRINAVAKANIPISFSPFVDNENM